MEECGKVSESSLSFEIIGELMQQVVPEFSREVKGLWGASDTRLRDVTYLNQSDSDLVVFVDDHRANLDGRYDDSFPQLRDVMSHWLVKYGHGLSFKVEWGIGNWCSYGPFDIYSLLYDRGYGMRIELVDSSEPDLPHYLLELGQAALTEHGTLFRLKA